MKVLDTVSPSPSLFLNGVNALLGKDEIQHAVAASRGRFVEVPLLSDSPELTTGVFVVRDGGEIKALVFGVKSEADGIQCGTTWDITRNQVGLNWDKHRVETVDVPEALVGQSGVQLQINNVGHSIIEADGNITTALRYLGSGPGAAAVESLGELDFVKTQYGAHAAVVRRILSERNIELV